MIYYILDIVIVLLLKEDNSIMALNYQDQMAKVKESIQSPEQMLGKGLNQPMNCSNSGTRKILSAIQEEHGLNIIEPEIPIIQTGYEIRFGDYSSSILELDDDYTVIKKIQKFSDEKVKNHHYFLILLCKGTVNPDKKGQIHIVERISYNHNTESYGFLMNNDVLDSLKEGSEIEHGEPIKRSMAYDKSGNRCDGVNLNVVYLAKSKTTEDGFQLSETGAYKLRSPLIHKVECIVNDNDILLNLYGNDQYHKSFPDIGEDIQNGILVSIRREKIEDALYMQSKDRLKTIFMSDDSRSLNGKVIDIDIMCNVPENLNKETNVQLKKYYEERMRMNREIVDCINKLFQSGQATSISYEARQLQCICEDELNGFRYTQQNGKIYNGTMIRFTVLYVSIPEVGDKISNRYGGKGVISEIVPDELMPLIDNGERAELIFNASTCINRLNDGQLKELTHIGSRILELISFGVFTYDEAIDMILDYIEMCSPNQARELREILKMNESDPNFKRFYVDSILDEGFIALSMKPMSEALTLDDIDRLYQKFPWVKQNTIYSPMKDSNGNYRYIKSIRPITCGKLFIYRLKQYAEEKFSVTSLSSTNIRNQNSRSKENKNYKAVHSNTPIRFGDMEHLDYSHFGTELVKSIMMLYSSSPQARLLVQKVYTGDPYEVNIELDGKSRDRSAEILNVRFKTIGLRLEFIRIPKHNIAPVLIQPVTIHRNMITPVSIEKDNSNFDPIAWYNKSREINEEFRKHPVHFTPFAPAGNPNEFKKIEDKINKKYNKAIRDMKK